MLSFVTSAWSKGETVKIMIVGDKLASPIEITCPDIVGQFNIWNGPGVGTRGPDGAQHPPAYLDPERTAGRFIDWPRGNATDLPSGMQRLEVTFYIAGRKTPVHDGKYLFAYEIDSVKRRGYIYLPRWRGSYISHGVEGNWFYASERWDELIMRIILAASEDSADSSSHGRFGCKFGTAKITNEGAIELYRSNEDGSTRLNYRYLPTSDLYDSVKDHVGEIAAGDEVEVSCWPPRS